MTRLGSKNPAVQHLRRLNGRRSARTGSGQFVIDGPVLVTEALDAGITVDEAFVDAEAAPAVLAVVARLHERGVPVRELAPGVLASATDTVTPNGIAAIARRPARPIDEILRLSGAAIVAVLAGVADPGNAGTILRSAEAAGASAVVATAGSVDLFGPKTVRAAAGALFHLPVVGDVPDEVAIAGLRQTGVRLLGTAARTGRPYDEVDLTGAVAFVLGNEAHGVDVMWADAVDEWITIPMVGRVESLNVAMAGTLLCFEAARQRRSYAAQRQVGAE